LRHEERKHARVEIFTSGLSIRLLDLLMAARKVKLFLLLLFFNTSRLSIRVFKLFVKKFTDFFKEEPVNQGKCRLMMAFLYQEH